MIDCRRRPRIAHVDRVLIDIFNSRILINFNTGVEVISTNPSLFYLSNDSLNVTLAECIITPGLRDPLSLGCHTSCDSKKEQKKSTCSISTLVDRSAAESNDCDPIQ